MNVSTLVSIAVGMPKRVLDLVAERKNGITHRRVAQTTPGGPEWAHEMLRRATEDAAYLQKRWQPLMAKYPEQWIAIREQKVIAHADTLESVLSELIAKGIDPAWTTIEFLTHGTRHLIL